MITIFNNGDLRQFYVYKELTEQGIEVSYSNSDLKGVVILPITTFDLKGIDISNVECFFIAKDNTFIKETNKKTYKYINNTFLIDNAHLTSEGLIKEIHSETNQSIKDLNITIIGYGRCAITFANMYSNIGANITIYTTDSKENQNALIQGYKTIDKIKSNDLIINTIPHLILNKETLSNLAKDTIILDIASSPGGVDFNYADKINIRAKHVLGIPGKETPKSAAILMSKEIINKLKEFNI